MTDNANVSTAVDQRQDEDAVTTNGYGASHELHSDTLISKQNGSLHMLLLLSDSALPLGSFAFSNGLESCLVQHRQQPKTTRNAELNVFIHYLHTSIVNTASTALPFVLATYSIPERLEELDDLYDASTSCTVARRASIAQGRALLTLWEKGFRSPGPDADMTSILAAFSVALRSPPPTTSTKMPAKVHAHLPPLFGVVASMARMSRMDTAYVFLLNHAKAMLSAGVRAGVLGPFAMQSILAGQGVFAERDGKVMGMPELLQSCIEREKDLQPEDAAITVPLVDVWQGRHELLYSRIFNS